MPYFPHQPGTVGAHGPIKPSKFDVNTTAISLAVPGPIQGDDGDDWWAGVQQCAVTVALAATLAVTALSTAQAAQVAQSSDEAIDATMVFDQNEIWVNPVAPVWSWPVPVVFTEPEELPAGALFGQPDEDFWQSSVRSSAQWVSVLFTSSQAGQAPPSIVEDEYWQNRVAPVAASLYQPLPYLPDAEELPAGKLFGQPDEDFWINPVAPVAGYPFLQVFTDEALDATTVLDADDRWANPVAPIASYPPPLTFTDDDVIAPTAVLGVEEDFWQFSVRQSAQWLSLLFTSSQAAQTTPQPVDEDFWINPVAPVWSYPVPLVFIDDDVITSPVLGTDEDFWQNPVPPVVATTYQRLPLVSLVDPEELPAGKFFGQPDEDFWVNAVAPVASYPVPKVFTDDDTVTKPILSTDEDFWVNPVAPVPATLGRLYLPDPEEIPAAALFARQFDEDFWQSSVRSSAQWISLIFTSSTAAVPSQLNQPDEDFWINAVAPIWSYPVPLVFIDDDVIEQAPLLINTDEDFWSNPVTPVVGANTIALPYLPDPEQVIAGITGGSIPIDEDTWRYQIDVPAAWNALVFSSGTGAFTITASALVEDNTWTNPVAPWPSTLGPLYLPDPEEIPAGSLATATAQPDEDFWINPVEPVVATNYQNLPLLSDEIPGTLTGPPPVAAEDDSFTVIWPPEPLWQIVFYLDDGNTPLYFMEEGYWQNVVAPAPVYSYPVPIVFTDTDTVEIVPIAINTDEDFWKNTVTPVQQVFAPLYLPDPEELSAGNFVSPGGGNPEEFYWVNPVAPVPFTLWQALPYLPDIEEVSAGSLRGQPDEDFWSNPTAPVAASNWQRLPQGSLTDPEELPINLFGQPDEDFWKNPVLPTPASLYVPLPYLPDPEELPVLSGQMNEDYWVNPVEPVVSYQLPLVFAFEDDLITLGSDEDFWINPVPPVVWAVPIQAITADEETTIPPPIPDEDFWINPVAPVSSYPVPIVFTDDEIKEIQVLPPDEDFWINPVAPVPFTLGPLCMPDPDPEALPTVYPAAVLGSGQVFTVKGGGSLTAGVLTAQLSFVQLAADPLNGPNGPLDAARWSPSGFGDPALQVFNNQCCALLGGAPAINFYTGISWPDDQWVEVAIENLGPSFGNIIVQLRSTPDAQFGYRFLVVGALGTAQSGVVIFRVTNGVTVSIFSLNGTTFVSGDKVKFAVIGSTVYMFVNGSFFAKADDPGGPASGGVILSLSNFGTSLTDVSVTNFAGGKVFGTGTIFGTGSISKIRGRGKVD